MSVLAERDKTKSNRTDVPITVTTLSNKPHII